MFRAGSTGWFDTKTSTMFAWHVQNDVKRGGPPPKQVSISNPRKARWFCIRTWFKKRVQELPHAEMTINQSAADIIFKSLPYHCDPMAITLFSTHQPIITTTKSLTLFAFQRLQRNQHLFKVATTKLQLFRFFAVPGKLLTPPTSLTDPAASPMRPPSRGWDWLAIAKKNL